MQMVSGCARCTSARLSPFVKKSPVKRASASKGHSLTNHPRTNLPFLTNIVRRELKAAATTGVDAGGEGTCPFKPYLCGAGRDDKRAAGNVGADVGTLESHTSSDILFRDDTCILVRDAYPKSAVHCLVIPLDLRLISLIDLDASHVQLLRHMHQTAHAYAAYVKQSCPEQFGRARFITGFHALPSLPMLHMHLISMDLDSACLKTKKHYNSFATSFFLTSERVIADLEEHGRITINADVRRLKDLEEQSMKCLWCGVDLATIPMMKQHIKTCPSNMSLE